MRSEHTEWVRSWYALGTLVYGLGYYGGIHMMYGFSTEWVWTEGGGWDDNIGLNRCSIDFRGIFLLKKTLIFLPPPGPYPVRISTQSCDGNPGS